MNRELKNTVPIEKAAEWVQNWRNGRMKADPFSIHSITMERINYEQVLADPGVVKVKSYLAVNDEGNMTLLIVGADADDRDLLAVDASAHHAYDMANLCPPFCRGDGPLG